MWRANRLVDGLAKAAVKPTRVPSWVTKRITHFARLVEYSAARLGMATHVANNCKMGVPDEQGSLVCKVSRDSTAERPDWRAKRGAKRLRPIAPGTECSPKRPASDGWAPAEASSRVRGESNAHSETSGVRQQARAAAASRHVRAERLAGHSQVQRWLRERTPAATSGPSASGRMQAIRERLQARIDR